MSRSGSPVPQAGNTSGHLPLDGGSSARESVTAWPEGALELARELQRKLAIGDRQWHQLKRQRPRRGAEQLAAALVQLLADDHPARVASTPARERAMELADHGLAWLRAELSDPGCPSHGR
jgi:DnaJ-domain-containing protein 1